MRLGQPLREDSRSHKTEKPRQKAGLQIEPDKPLGFGFIGSDASWRSHRIPSMIKLPLWFVHSKQDKTVELTPIDSSPNEWLETIKKDPNPQNFPQDLHGLAEHLTTHLGDVQSVVGWLDRWGGYLASLPGDIQQNPEIRSLTRWVDLKINTLSKPIKTVDSDGNEKTERNPEAGKVAAKWREVVSVLLGTTPRSPEPLEIVPEVERVEVPSNVFGFQSVADLDESDDEIEWLVDGYIQRGALVHVQAKKKQGKTFGIMALAARVANEGGRVLYLCTEDPKTVKRRLRALHTSGHLTNPQNVILSTVNVNIIAHAQTLADSAREAKADMVVIDTQTEYLHGDENNPGTMGEYVRALKKITATGAALVNVHHCGGNGANRGHDHVPNAADHVYTVKKDDKTGHALTVIFKSEAQRSTADPAPLVFNFEEHGETLVPSEVITDVSNGDLDDDSEPTKAPTKPKKQSAPGEVKGAELLRLVVGGVLDENPDIKNATQLARAVWDEYPHTGKNPASVRVMILREYKRNKLGEKVAEICNKS
ncbi:hypothetical protein JCM19240_3986 [Vibrio maritimus]|uniref:Uncharacterized protein n=1 Tax=Vibrio maritimus TaxID=990268 RepID=A0A090TED1_9VIBR|nr:hypothetical protein JCM19240_3986 [Vibrio maritimus]